MPISQQRLISLITAAEAAAEPLATIKEAFANAYARISDSTATSEDAFNELFLLVQRTIVPPEAQITLRLEQERIARTRERNERYSVSKSKVR